MIRDLLNPSSGILDMREDSKGGIQVAGLTEVKARSTAEVSTTYYMYQCLGIKVTLEVVSEMHFNSL